ncbi:MAG: hypothetical protein Q9202_000950 [Teloschistes flavicans]
MEYIHDRAKRCASERVPKNPDDRMSKSTAAPARKVSMQAPLAPRGMGLKETEIFIDKLVKENWSLKLDITMQRKAEEKLRAKAEKADELEKRTQDLERSNEDLAQEVERVKKDSAQELQKRDLALQEAFDVIDKLETDTKSVYKAQSNKLLLKMAALSILDSAAAASPDTTSTSGATEYLRTPERKAKYTDDWVFDDSPSPTKPIKPIEPTVNILPSPAPTRDRTAISTTSSTLSLRTASSFETSKPGYDDYSDRDIEEMSLVSNFDPTRDYRLEAMGYMEPPAKAPPQSPPPRPRPRPRPLSPLLAPPREQPVFTAGTSASNHTLRRKKAFRY